MQVTRVSERLLGLEWPQAVHNSKSGQTYYLFPNSRSYQKPDDPRVIAELCNQEAIYDFLFTKMLGGKTYELEHAKGFLEWSNQGWESSAYFVFLLRAKDGSPVACIDIKQCDLHASEIGYWCSAEVSGLMTNAVATLAQVAKTVGFEKLTAITLKDNLRSQKVLLKNGFADEGEFVDEGEAMRKFEKVLAT